MGDAPNLKEMVERAAALTPVLAERAEEVERTRIIHPDTVRDFADMGYNLLSLGADVVALSEYADKMMAAFDRV